MPGDYGYANARIRALKSTLLVRSDYEASLAAPDSAALIQQLVRTAYKPDLEAALVRYDGMQCIADALRRHLTRTVGSLPRFFDGHARELIGQLLARWDLFNLLVILRGQIRGVAADEMVNALVPAGMLRETELRELVKQPTIQATSELMLTWRLPFAGPLAQALRLSGGELADLESRLYQIRFREALSLLGSETNDAMVREMLMMEIDVVNLALLFRLWPGRRQATSALSSTRADDVQRLLIAGGSLSHHLLAGIVDAPDVAAIIGHLADTPYGVALRPRLEEYEQSEGVTVVERALESLLARKGISLFHRDPLTIGSAIGYLWAKTTEVTNLRWIAQGKELGWSADAARGELILQ